MEVYLYVRVFIAGVYAWKFICMCGCLYMYMHGSLYVRVFIGVYAWKFICMCECLYVYMHGGLYVCASVYMCICVTAPGPHTATTRRSGSRTRDSGVGGRRSNKERQRLQPLASVARAPLFEVRRVRFTHSPYWHSYIRYTHPPKPHSHPGHGTNVTPRVHILPQLVGAGLEPGIPVWEAGALTRNAKGYSL